MGLLTETNEQYYGGQQSFIGTGGATSFTWTGDTPLVGTVTNVSFTNFTVTINNVYNYLHFNLQNGDYHGTCFIFPYILLLFIP